MSKEVEIIIDKEGKVEIDQTGFVGKECAEVADKLVEALGNKLKQTKKAEYYKAQQKTTQKQFN